MNTMTKFFWSIFGHGFGQLNNFAFDQTTKTPQHQWCQGVYFLIHAQVLLALPRMHLRTEHIL